MNTYAILEFEEGSMALTVGGSVAGTAEIFACNRFPLVEINSDTVRNALRALGSDPLRGAKGVHVIVGDRRATHFVATVPRMTEAEVGSFLTREALRLASLTEAGDLLLAPRLLEVLPDRRLRIAMSALPTGIWDRVQKACAAAGVEVLSLHTTESCLALAAPPEDSDTAVLELSGGRARFVYCSHNAPVQVRRFILGNGPDAGSMALAAQLAIELPRTYDWLRESGHDEPRSLIVGNRLGLDEDSIEMLRGDLESVGPPEDAWRVTEGDSDPGLASTELMQRLFASTMPPSLLEMHVIRVPWPRRVVVSLAAAVLMGLASAVFGVFEAQKYLDIAEEAERLEADCDRLGQAVLQAQALAAPSGEFAVPDPQLELALSMRRPVSRLVAEVSNLATDRVHVESLQFASTEKVVLAGAVKGQSRQEALAVLSQFVDGLRELPYLQAGRGDEIQEMPGRPNLLRFRIAFSWRNS
ncbi:MAG: hypothetical protein NXI31_16365 [bacterium]|nr:hypothetical protein [bacterium]